MRRATGDVTYSVVLESLGHVNPEEVARIVNGFRSEGPMDLTEITSTPVTVLDGVGYATGEGLRQELAAAGASALLEESPVPGATAGPASGEALGQPWPAKPAIRVSWLTPVGYVLTAAGFGLYIAFGSEQADSENAGEIVSAGVRAGAWAGAVLFLGGLIALVWEGVRRGRKEGRLVRRIAAEIGLGLLAMLAGFIVMLLVVEIAFA